MYAPFVLLAFAAVLAVGALSAWQASVFQPYFGSVSPPLAVLVAVVVGGACLAPLRASGFRPSVGPLTGRGALVAAATAVGFAAAVTIADVLGGFPRDMNVAAPASLLFYPAMALVAEVSFHLVPLTILLSLLPPGWPEPDRRLWVCIGVVALLEPAFQLRHALADGRVSAFEAYTAVHVFAFDLAQLLIFRRYDFLSMYLVRLIYYGWWHILWGAARLEVLF